MSNKAWKQFERDSAALIGGTRFWANSGEAIDVEGPRIVGQCKQVQTLSLQALNNLVVVAEEQAEPKGKVGVVMVKLRMGKGKKTLPLVVMSFEGYEKLTKEQS